MASKWLRADAWTWYLYRDGDHLATVIRHADGTATSHPLNEVHRSVEAAKKFAEDYYAPKAA